MPIALLVARIVIVILVWRKLRRVHKNGDDHLASLPLRKPDQLQMPFVKPPHRWDQRDLMAAATPLLHHLPQLVREADHRKPCAHCPELDNTGSARTRSLCAYPMSCTEIRSRFMPSPFLG